MITDLQVLIRLSFAGILGGIIGFEREKHGRAAGFRTHILVSIGSALVMLTSLYMYELYGSKVPIDPGRIAAGIVTGIGFLGAGTIIRSGATVRGLTTAASLWSIAGIGMAVGCGFYIAAMVATLLIFVTLFLLRRIYIEEEHKR